MMSTSPFFIASFKAAKLSKYLITTVVPVRSVMRIPIISVTMERLGVLTLPTTSDFPTHADARPAKTDAARTATTNKNDNLFIFNTSSKKTDRTFLSGERKVPKESQHYFCITSVPGFTPVLVTTAPPGNVTEMSYVRRSGSL